MLPLKISHQTQIFPRVGKITVEFHSRALIVNSEKYYWKQKKEEKNTVINECITRDHLKTELSLTSEINLNLICPLNNSIPQIFTEFEENHWYALHFQAIIKFGHPFIYVFFQSTVFEYLQCSRHWGYWKWIKQASLLITAGDFHSYPQTG